MVIEDGFIYEGEISQGEPHGYGKQYHPGMLFSKSHSYATAVKYLLQKGKKAMKAIGTMANSVDLAN